MQPKVFRGPTGRHNRGATYTVSPRYMGAMERKNRALHDVLGLVSVMRSYLPETSKIELCIPHGERWNPQFPPERRGVRPSLLDILEDTFHLQRTSARQSSTPKGALTIRPAVPKSSHPTHLYSRGPGFCLEVQRAWWTTCRPLLGVWEVRDLVGVSNNVDNLQKVTIFMIELAWQ